MENYLKLVCPSEDKLKSLKSHELRNSRLFVIFLHITLIPLMLFTIVNYISGKYLAAHIDLVGFFTFLGILFYFNFTGHYKRSVISFVMGCQTVIALQHLIAPVGLGTNLLWLPLIIITSSYLLGKGWGVRLGIFNALAMILAEALPKYIQIPTENFIQSEILYYNISIIAVTTLSAFFVIDRIIFEEQVYLQGLKKQKKDLFEEKEGKAALLNIIAHDIANPLTIIEARLNHLNQQLNGAQVNFNYEEARSHIRQILRRSEEITKNIELIRNYRAYKTGKLEIKLSPVDLNQVIDSSLDVFHEKIEAKRISLLKTYDTNKDYLIQADPSSLQMSVINNLISNAIKFSHPNGIIEISLCHNKSVIEFKIRDYGIGIPDEIKPFLFSSARPTSRKGTRGELGTGFGMPILKMFLDKYDADIKVSSPAEGGTLFTINFQRMDIASKPHIISAKSFLER